MILCNDPFRALKAKKAAHGFQARISPENLPRIGEAIRLSNEADPTVEVVINSMSNTVTVYTNNDRVADIFKDGQFI